MNKQFKLDFKEGNAWKLTGEIKEDDVFIYIVNIFLPENRVKSQKEFDKKTVIEYTVKEGKDRRIVNRNIVNFKQMLGKLKYEVI